MDQTTKDYLKKNNLEAVIFGLILTIIGIIFTLITKPKDISPNIEPPSEFEMRGGNLWK